ncbi:hypothetical protein AUEXF2481DRAFT_202120 [Aureobasidium subglaciale EXF-2481]|uniref:Uncharacterized protein n=1 Tax=Aureobasidium subglaciale (strain EXF-2481) TaxID=1043005 RepID=A0A074YUN8_AURSE|nr:uncharacterized protein AUEXF2481DRAFT_202120 [Aureobasidium subglaciale EXF-2481]KEQ99884.1 hypothetical protein AUEXF2481DRAFT_202120 [Aureobasidium subglaciale EXF-2481]
MSNATGLQAGSLAPLFWAHVSIDGTGHPKVLRSYGTTVSSTCDESDGMGAASASRVSGPGSDHHPRSSISSAASTMSTESTTTPPESLVSGYPVRVKIRRASRARQPVLRRCCSPTTESLREIRQRQSEEDLRNLYEAQTLAYLNDAIQF